VINSVLVVAVVMMGDPRFTKGMPFNKGTAKGTGVSRMFERLGYSLLI
jgi:hypothetical protein